MVEPAKWDSREMKSEVELFVWCLVGFRKAEN